MSPLRIVFMGTAELSCASLEALAASPAFQVVGVVTQPDRPKGRELKPQASAVKTLALRLGLPLLQPERARNEEFLHEMQALAPDLIAVAAYGQILPKSILDLPRFGCLNVHTSLLPKYRGAAPIQWAILNGDAETGVTIMKMDLGLDTGDILLQESTLILPEDDAQTLHDRLARMGADLLVRAILQHAAGKLVAQAQPPEAVTYAPKIKKQDGQIDWSQTADQVWHRVRALTPWPGTYTFLPASPLPLLIKIWKVKPEAASGSPGQILAAERSGLVVACEVGALRILELQREGGRRLKAQEFLAGHILRAGEKFGSLNQAL